jgi:hypothetical protein
VGYDITDQLLIRFLHSPDSGKRNGSTLTQYISYSQILRKPMIQLGGKYFTIFSLSLGYP